METDTDPSEVELINIMLPNEFPTWERVRSTLEKDILNPEQLNNALREITDMDKEWNFWKRYENMENEEVQLFWTKVMPFVKSLILEMPILFPTGSLYYLLRGQDKTVTLSRKQVACLVASGMMGLWRGNCPHMQYHSWNTSCLNILTLFQNYSGRMAEFATCIVNYFFQISQEMPKGCIRIHRKVLLKSPQYAQSILKVCKVTVTDEPIENHINDPFHADFANCFIGGGVLGGGCVQEEILFVIKPECLVSMLLCTKMEANEAIIITGTQQFSKYKGYGFTFKFDGNNQDKTPWDEGYNCYKNHIIAVDATTSFRQQFSENLANRDIDKLYIGLKDLQTEESQPPLSRPVYVTGNWGCGAFGGDKQLKAVQQIISATEAGVDLIYSIFNEKVFGEEFTKFLQVLVENEVTVGELYRALMEYQPTNSLFEHMCSKIIENRTSLAPGVTGL